MKEAALKIDLYAKIEHANIDQLKVLYGLVTDYFNGSKAIEEWGTLPELQQKLITKVWNKLMPVWALL